MNINDLVQSAIKKIIQENQHEIRNWYKSSEYNITGVNHLRELHKDDLHEAKGDWVFACIDKYTKEVCNILGISTDTVQNGNDYHIDLLNNISDMVKEALDIEIDLVTELLISDMPTFEEVNECVVDLAEKFNQFWDINDLQDFCKELKDDLSKVSVLVWNGIEHCNFPSIEEAIEEGVTLNDVRTVNFAGNYGILDCPSVYLYKGKVNENEIYFNLYAKKNEKYIIPPSLERACLIDIKELVNDGIIISKEDVDIQPELEER